MQELLEKHKKYATTEEAFAILFVKKYLKQSSGMWVDILNYQLLNHYDYRNLQFKKVKCELFKRTINPVYPPKSEFEDEEEYYMICRAITWEAANEDIEQQRANGIKGKFYTLEGVRFKDFKKKKPPYFKKDAPKELKALEKNLNDRTDPLWSKATKYINPDYLNFDPYSFKIISIKRINSNKKEEK